MECFDYHPDEIDNDDSYKNADCSRAPNDFIHLVDQKAHQYNIYNIHDIQA